VEWDILNVPASKHVKRYDDRYEPQPDMTSWNAANSAPGLRLEPQPDITFNVTIRRKTLFHTVNLIIRCTHACERISETSSSRASPSPSSPSSSFTCHPTGALAYLVTYLFI